ncbi:uncharacterized protein F4822DRAFT_387472 [Hypoxylon trugodes]|uniref:uncharacterized protein n=1 Tax=Hypoxylon trugodes TaxID=326681 RepID=UPI00218CB0D7|nr:uncharacterized protein F4822DRAFT_387472 [Hypoxylon trugodes]KAI1394212.1 hypothetical protein F4822DRAFT_387472 [Hypoxylon trugodes]
MILKFVQEDEEQEDEKDIFCLVKAKVIAASRNGMVLQCSRHEFRLSGRITIGNTAKDGQAVEDIETYLDCASQDTLEGLKTRPPKLSRPPNLYTVVIGTASAIPCLYTSIRVPDIIATMEGGICWVYQEGRFICPGCTGGKAQRFNSFMGCGVDLACPLCMGTELSEEHKNYLKSYYYHGSGVDGSEGEEEMRDQLEEQLEKLGYMNNWVPEGAWKIKGMYN